MSNKFYIEEQWITNYKLSGNDLLIFARLASFTLNVGGYNGSIEWLGWSIGIAKRTTIDIIAKLENRGLIERGGGMIKCVFQPITRGEKSAPFSAKSAPKNAEIASAEIAPNGAKSARKSAESAPKYNKEIIYTNKCSDSVIVEANTHTTPTLDFLYQFFKSKIANEMDESCIHNLAKKFSNLEQAQLFCEYVQARKSTLHLGMLTKLHDEIFRCACEWDAQGRPTPRPQQPTPAPQPQPQIPTPQENAEKAQKSAEIWNNNQWRAQVFDCVEKHPKTAKKSWITQMHLTNGIYDEFPTPCDLAVINQFIDRL